MKRTLFLLFFLSSTIVFSQQDNSKEYTIWDEVTVAYHGSVGVDRSAFTEFGISKFYIVTQGYFPLSKDYFASVEIYPTVKPESESPIYGFKVGCEYSAMVMSLACEVKYQTDLELHDFVITPKVGLGAFGVLTFYYGINVSTNNKPFSRVGTHQFSMVWNVNKKIFSI